MKFLKSLTKIKRDGPSTCGKDECDVCRLNEKIICRYGKCDSIMFLGVLIPYYLLVVLGALKTGLAIWLLAWLVYGFVFFNIIEPIILCRYCPYWGIDKNILKCHANYGVIKLYKYISKKAPKIMRVLFIIFALIFMLSPLVLLIFGREYVLAIIGLSNVITAIFIYKRTVCTKCINFSCVMNAMDEQLRAKYFEMNEELKEGWKI